MHYVDRSRVEVGQDCPRKRWHNYHRGGTGVVPVGDAPDLAFGKAIHSQIELANHSRYLLPTAVEPEMTTPDGEWRDSEWAALYQGLTSTFKKWTLPQILEEYEWVSSEQELTLQLAPDIAWMTRLDGVLRRKADGLYFVLEAKTSAWMKQLAAQAPYNFQLLMEIEALRRHLGSDGSDIGGALLLVFDKGQKRQTSEGERRQGKEGFRRLSPFTYWYKREKASGETDYSLSYKPGWDRVPTWTIPGWWDILVENWPEEAKETVQLWPSVAFDPERVESVIRQVVARERQVHHALSYPEIVPLNLDADFPQNFSHCSDFGRTCPYEKCCFTQIDPIESGLFVPRIPNHPQEAQ